jgi:NRAMP (natural resistance-associated macrophage protein)-like metal ion transporter
MSIRSWAGASAILAFLLLFIGSYKLIERVLVGLVVLMSLTFLTTAVIVAPSLGKILQGMFWPSFPPGALLTITGLIGTTVVPYNLFLHASAVQERWKDRSGVGEARLDISVAVLLGGLISMAIVVTSATAFFGSATAIKNGADLALQLRPLLGEWGRYFVGAGLFAAGISSAITAPLAAAYASCGVLGWKRDLRSARFRLVWGAILGAGTAFSVSGFKPLEAILFAQAANGILLPVSAIFLLLVMNSKEVLGNDSNGRLSNALAVPVVLVAMLIGMRSLLLVFGVL